MADLPQTLANLRGARDEQGAMLSLLTGIIKRVKSRCDELDESIASTVATLQGSSDYRVTSPVDDRGSAERTAGQYAVAKAIKLDPTVTVEAAKTAWWDSAVAYRKSIGRTIPIHNPDGCLEDYLLDLHGRGLFPEPTWESFRTWISVTPIDKLGI